MDTESIPPKEKKKTEDNVVNHMLNLALKKEPS